jgi:hypothetical protein
MAGPQVTLGYWRDAEKTAAAFVVPPGSDAVHYRTGDLVRRPVDGAPMTFQGRADTQIKVRGYRIELPEIEAVLPLLATQGRTSQLPTAYTLLIERTATGRGGRGDPTIHHAFLFPFEGRLVHDGLATHIYFFIALYYHFLLSITVRVEKRKIKIKLKK